VKPQRPATRARTTLTALAALAALTLAACSDGAADSPGSSALPDAPSTVAAPAAAADSAYPVTIDTKFGPVTLDAAPDRVVALGWGDAETALALGVQPVGASDWMGFGGEGVGPWSAGLYDTPPVILGTLELSYEAVAALEPDLILDTRAAGDQERYDRLAAIAPTIGVPEGGDAYLTSTAEQTRMIAAALGQVSAGEALIASIDEAFAAAAAAHPQWEGLTATSATRTSEGWGAYVEGSERVTFLERLGFVQNPAIAALTPNEGALGFSVSLSAEQIGQFDADLIVAFPIWIDTAEITDDPQWQAIPAVAAGHVVIIEGDLSAAYSAATVPGTLYAIDQLVPLIEGALA